ncbi:MAG TPA: hypothetical protein VI603_02160 [Saprospiraceae bacterium]|nr:hypothetical protein [Saprospiraceae bacterium]
MKHHIFFASAFLLTSFIDLHAQDDGDHPWHFGLHFGNSWALYPHAEWNSFDRFTIIDGAISHGLYDALAHQIGYIFFPGNAMARNVYEANPLTFTVQRNVAKHWSVGFQYRYVNHEHHAIQIMVPVDSVGFPFAAEASTSVELWEAGLIVTRSFGNKNFRPLVSIGGGLTGWHQEKIRAEIMEISFPISPEKRHFVRPIMPGAGFIYQLNQRVQFRFAFDVTILVEESKAPGVVEHATAMIGVVYGVGK